MKLFLARQWFLIGLVAVLAIGFAFWEPLTPWVRWFPEKFVVALVLFLMSWSLDSHAMWRALSRPTAAVLAIAVNFALVPLLAWAATRTLPAELGQGLCLAAALPCTLASAAVWTRRAGGNDAVALLVTMCTNLSCFLMTPLLLWMTTGISAGGSFNSPQKMVLSLGLVAVLPMVLGQLLRIPKPLAQWATSNKTPLSVVCLFGILTIVLLGAISSGSELHKPEVRASLQWHVWLLMLAAAGGVHTAALAFGYATARALRIAREEAIAVAFSGSQKTLMVGLHVALALNFGIGVLPLLVYHVLQLMIDTLAADWLKRGACPKKAAVSPADENAIT